MMIAYLLIDLVREVVREVKQKRAGEAEVGEENDTDVE